MRLVAWNVEGLTPATESTITEFCDRYSVDLFVAVETWVRSPRLAQPVAFDWARLDVICPQPDPRAVRGKGGISLFSRRHIGPRLWRHCPAGSWAVWYTATVIVVGVYTPPRYDRFSDSITALADSVTAAARFLRLPVHVVGDFNCRLGDLAGDSLRDPRSPFLIDTMAHCGLSCLNLQISRSPHRWTWVSAQGRSVVDLAFCSSDLDVRLHIGRSLKPSGHQLVCVMSAPVAIPEALEADGSRWNWSRRRLSSKLWRPMCSELLFPWLVYLTNFWDEIMAELDCNVDASRSAKRELIDEGYDYVCVCLRYALSGVVCWPPGLAERPPMPNVHLDWADLCHVPDSFFVSKANSALQSAANAESRQNGSGVPSPTEFADYYAELFRARPDTPVEPFSDAARSTGDLESFEKEAFDASCLAERLERCAPRKALGQDNLPVDLFRLQPLLSGFLLERMFLSFYAHQITPTVWRTACMVPIPKPGGTSPDPADWRGIALQCHLKKTFELSIRSMLRKKKWTAVHQLQLGFQDNTGAPDAVYVADELLSHYRRIGLPLTTVLLDIRKAYDRVPRALVWRKLSKRGVPAPVLGVLQELMDETMVCVNLDGRLSEAVKAEVGVPQGAVLSPDLFNVFVNDLPARLVSAMTSHGCPCLAGVPIPVLLYADDQTLFHWDGDALQVMINECMAYAVEHQFEYNVAKSCIVAAHESAAPLLFLMDEPVPVVEETELLGVSIRNGGIDHSRQLALRLSQAEKALVGFDRLGGFRTDAIPVSKKRLLVTAWSRAKSEYGLAIATHSESVLSKVDQLMKRATGKCIGLRRGTILSMRFVGIIPSKVRATLLRDGFIRRLRHLAKHPDKATLPALVFADMAVRPGSRAFALLRPNQVLRCRESRLAELTDAYTSICHRSPTKAAAWRLSLVATDIALSELCWHQPSSLLLPVQRQPWHSPHPAAYISGPLSALLARWICNSIPGSNDPCRKCAGQYPLSRYHVSRCVEADIRLDPLLDNLPLSLFTPGRNCVDVACAGLVPAASVKARWIHQTPPQIVNVVRSTMQAKLPMRSAADERRAIAQLTRSDDFTAQMTLIGGVLRDVVGRCLPTTGVVGDTYRPP